MEFLACVHSVLTISGDDFGELYHTASSEPYFYDQNYTLVKRDFPFPLIATGGVYIIAEEVGDGHEKQTDQRNGDALQSTRV